MLYLRMVSTLHTSVLDGIVQYERLLFAVACVESLVTSVGVGRVTAVTESTASNVSILSAAIKVLASFVKSGEKQRHVFVRCFN
jgi:predicted membrane chloride channel (bestrophin family)